MPAKQTGSKRSAAATSASTKSTARTNAKKSAAKKSAARTKSAAKKKSAGKKSAATKKPAEKKKSAAKSSSAKKTAGTKAAPRQGPATLPKTEHIDGVLIVGGGYAGVHAATKVRCAGQPVTIVAPTGRHDFVTRLAGVAGATVPASDASTSLDGYASDVIEASMIAAADGAVTLDDGRTLTADAVVITAGARPIAPPIPGLEHALPLRTAEDALTLRERIAHVDSLVIIGGGATGVQLAGSAAHRYSSLDVTIVDGADELLSTMGASSRRDAARILDQRSVRVVLGELVESIDADGATVAGEHLPGLVVWAAGFEARADEFGLPSDDAGAISVGAYLLVDGWSHTFAAGDVASHLDADGDPLPASAQIAVQAGDGAGENALRLLAGEPLRDVELVHRGWVLDLGGYRGLAEFGLLALTAPFFDLLPPLLHWGIDVRHLVETRGVAGLGDLPG